VIPPILRIDLVHNGEIPPSIFHGPLEELPCLERRSPVHQHTGVINNGTGLHDDLSDDDQSGDRHSRSMKGADDPSESSRKHLKRLFKSLQILKPKLLSSHDDGGYCSAANENRKSNGL